MKAPATAGASLDEVDTPALIVELDAFDRNLEKMAASVPAGIKHRPHAKTHKCSAIARRQAQFGAIGICCQKVSEARAMVDHGIDDVYITNQIVGQTKLEGLREIADRATLATCVDHKEQVLALGQTFATAQKELKVLVEIDVGAGRCGVPPGDAAVALAKLIAQTPGLVFEGLQAYQGSAQHRRSGAERERLISTAVDAARLTKKLCEDNGLECNTITGAGTGTYQLEAASGVYNELQSGSYIFMDADYAKNEDVDNSLQFEHALFVLATVMSRPTSSRAVVDAGLKSFSVDSGLPVIAKSNGATYTSISDEHGVIELQNDALATSLGDRFLIIPGHCDPTVNLHDWYVGVRNGVVESVWPIEARGAIF